MIQFIVCLILTVITWPFVLVGTCIVFFGLLVMIGGDGPSSYPYLGPKDLYSWYKKVIESNLTALKLFIKQETK